MILFEIKNLRSICDNIYRHSLRKMMPIPFLYSSKNNFKHIKAIFFKVAEETPDKKLERNNKATWSMTDYLKISYLFRYHQVCIGNNKRSGIHL